MNVLEAVKQFSEEDTPQSDTPPDETGQEEAAQTEETTDDISSDISSETESAIEAQTDSEETPQSDTEPETFDVSYGEETLSLTLDELKKGYMRERDYQYKRGEDAKIAKEAQAKLEKLDATLGLVEVDLSNEVKWFESSEAKELKELDPEAYLKRYEDAQRKVSDFQKAKELSGQEKKNAKQKRQDEERKLLMEAIPEWNDKSIQEKDIGSIVGVLKEFGFTDDDLAEIDNHRYFLMARKLAQLEAINKQDVSSKKIVKKLKSALPGSSDSKESSQDRKIKEARAKLKSSGRMQDAIKLFSM